MISIPGSIPIHIFPFFWFLILMIGWINSASIQGTVIWAIVIFISVLIHEYGHALTAVAFGQKAEIELFGFGGLTKREGKHLKRWKEFIIILNGPLAGFLLVFLSAVLIGWIHAGEKKILLYALKVAFNVNLFWTILNLLPVLPLDGGHLLRVLLEGAFGVKGLKIAYFVSMLLAAVIGCYFFLTQELFIGAVFLMMAFEGYRSWTDVKELSSDDLNQELQRLLKEGIKDLQEGRQQEAWDKFAWVREHVSKGLLYVTATQYAARLLAEQGKLKQAYDWLLPLKNRLSPDYLFLLQQLAYQMQEWEETVKIGEQLYQQVPSSEVPLLTALSYAIMGQAKQAVGWLRCAAQMGVPNLGQILAKREFDAIRQTEDFQSLLRTLNLSH